MPKVRNNPMKLKVDFERSEGRWLATVTGPGFRALGDGATKARALRDAHVGALRAIAFMMEKGHLKVRSVVLAA